MNQPELAYIDSSVFLTYIAGPTEEPREYPLAKAFFKEIASHKRIGVLSYLTIMEILDVLRKWKGGEFDSITALETDGQRLTYVIDGAMKLYQKVILETLATPEFRLIETDGIDTSLMLRTAFEIMTDVKGVVRLYDNCKKCGYTRNGENFISVHKCVGTVDIIHALLAKAMKCNSFVTFDKGFIDLVNDQRLKPLSIEILRPPRQNLY